MAETFNPTRAETSLFSALLEAARRHGRGKPIIEDAERQPLSYGRLILGSLVLGAKFRALSRPGEAVGVLLPNVNGLAVTIFGLNAFGRVAALLNFTAGLNNITSAVHTAQVATVLTSRRFVKMASLQALVEGLAKVETAAGTKLRLIYLEDLRKEIGARDKLVGLVRSKMAARVHARYRVRPDKPAVILFTSGTEGAPKGVVLTNANLVANASQIWAHADGMLTAQDTAFNPLPMFHSFGLTAGTLTGLFNGMKVVLYPSPLHYKQVPKLIAATRSTVLFATDTFLQGYARSADRGELASIRYVIAGAEKVKESTRELWARQSGNADAVLLEGYGATECSPVLACNLPAINQAGSVGRLLPGIEAKLEPVEGIPGAGRLMVRGPNVMAGYMLSSTPGVIHPPAGGWHDTGDIVSLENGMVTIRGRAKRFAKIGGEMISLAAVETMTAQIWPESQHVALSAPDARKGEQLILVTDKRDADKAQLLVAARTLGFPELWVPKLLLVVASIPVLGSGKVDLPATYEMVRHGRLAA